LIFYWQFCFGESFGGFLGGGGGDRAGGGVRGLLSLRNTTLFLGAFLKLWKSTIRYVMSASPFDRMERLGSNWTDFHDILYSGIFLKSIWKVQFWLKSEKNNGYFTWVTSTLHDYLCTFLIISGWIILIMRNVRGRYVEKMKTHILYSITFPGKSCHLWDNVEKYSRAGQATDEIIIRRMRIACWIPKATDAP